MEQIVLILIKRNVKIETERVREESWMFHGVKWEQKWRTYSECTRGAFNKTLSHFSLFLLNHNTLLFIFPSYLQGVRLVCHHSQVLWETVSRGYGRLLVRTQRPESLFFCIFQNIERPWVIHCLAGYHTLAHYCGQDFSSRAFSWTSRPEKCLWRTALDGSFKCILSCFNWRFTLYR